MESQIEEASTISDIEKAHLLEKLGVLHLRATAVNAIAVAGDRTILKARRHCNLEKRDFADEMTYGQSADAGEDREGKAY